MNVWIEQCSGRSRRSANVLTNVAPSLRWPLFQKPLSEVVVWFIISGNVQVTVPPSPTWACAGVNVKFATVTAAPARGAAVGAASARGPEPRMTAPRTVRVAAARQRRPGGGRVGRVLRS